MRGRGRFWEVAYSCRKGEGGADYERVAYSCKKEV